MVRVMTVQLMPAKGRAMLSPQTSSNGYTNSETTIRQYPQSAERVVFLDWTRAFFMLLGLPFHAALIYAVDGDWLVNDAAQSDVLTWLAATSQTFRMPGFFFIAGYFAALMLAKRGAGLWLQDRTRRLLIPFATGLILLNPLQLALSALARPETAGFGAAFAATIARDPGRLLGHFWFLPTLMLLCLALAAIWPALVRGRDVLIQWAETCGNARCLTPVIAVPLLGFYAIIDMQMAEAAQGGDLGLGSVTGLLLIPPLAAVSYAPWFALGVAAWLAPRLFAVLSHGNIWALVLMATATPFLLHYLAPNPLENFGPGLTARAAFALGAVMAFLWLFRQIAGSGGPRIKRLVDASLIIYLLHQPLIVLAGWLLLPVALPVGVKWVLVIAFALVFSLIFDRAIRQSSPAFWLFHGQARGA